MLSTKKSNLAVFDLDHTLISANCSFLFGRHLFKKGWLSFFQVIKLSFFYAIHKISLISIEQLHHLSFDVFFKNKKKALIEEEVESFLKILPSLVHPLIFSKIQSDSLILSSSPDFLVKPIADYFKISGWKATTYKVDKQGCLCEIHEVMEGYNKTKSLQEYAEKNGYLKEQIDFYSDSSHDLPVFLWLGKGIAVNPDRKLKQFAERSGWEIIYDPSSKRSKR